MKIAYRYFPILLILFGAFFFGWNALSFYQGFSASTKLAEKTSDYKKEADFAPSSNKQLAKKSASLYKVKPRLGEKIGELTIPRLQEAYPIYEGTDDTILKKGAGHVVNSVLPGEKSNSIISGHRDTIFRGLRHLKVHDELIVTTDAGSFLYKIKKIRIVDADDRTVMTPKPRATLTVTTCYPFYFIGNAPQRYIIVAEMISSKAAVPRHS